MTCYIVPTTAAVILLALTRAGVVRGEKLGLLTTLLCGGAIFGLIDHAWNGELLMMGPSLGTDLGLGFTITAGIVGIWGVVEFRTEIKEALGNVFQGFGFLRK